jgi:Mce-associated membrane protein
VPPSRRQPPRSTPPARRPRVAGLRKPSDESPAERTGQLPAVPPVPPPASSTPPAETRKPRPRPAPRPMPRPVAKPAADEPFEAASGRIDTTPAEDTAVFAAVGSEEDTKLDALTGEPEAPTDTEAEPARPAPRRKKRDTGIAKPTEVEEVPEEFDVEPAGPAKSRAQRPYLVAGALVLVALLLGGLAFWFHTKESAISTATSNTALLDVAKTAQVKDAVSKAAEALFSYDFNNIKKTEDAANDLLANDDVRNKYNSLMGEVKRLAPGQKMIVTCKVTRAAVIMLNDDLAKVMVFVDQTSTRTDTKKTTAGTAQLHLNAQLQGDKWKITDMDTYNAPKVPAATQAPSSAPASPAPSK